MLQLVVTSAELYGDLSTRKEFFCMCVSVLPIEDQTCALHVM